MISFTYSSNDTALQIATNWFAFAGLTLDVLGASGGVVHAVNLQLYIPRLQEAVNRTEAFHAAAAQVRDLLGQHSSASRAQIAASLREMNAITHQLRLWARGPLTSNPQGPNADSLWGRVFNGVTNVLAASEGTGIKQASLPMVAYGTVCLLLDIMCFAVSTQAKVVWGSAIAIAAVSFIAIVAPVVLLRFREMLALWQFRLDEAREDDMYKEIAFTETLADSNPSIVHELP
ncbi:hypothetical protein PLICRDRAFT_266462 [Plicaturopsis crispa FD-325 SS-3]|nr:hypothetical protein PLICRDRAFT_266462 [Plicaturopsis crispa FD-325 SS-3]